ncbi:hypothetical protein JHK87_046209 [Glycine soja]|nr:hypothetical protein JHK87_046209 [Glycine soja]
MKNPITLIRGTGTPVLAFVLLYGSALLIKSSSALLHHIHTISRTCSLTRFLFDFNVTRARAIDRHNLSSPTFFLHVPLFSLLHVPAFESMLQLQRYELYFILGNGS